MSAEIAIEPRSRRAMLAALGGGLLALIAQAIGRPLPLRAANGDPVLVGAEETGTEETSITVTGTATAFKGQSASGYGLKGVSDQASSAAPTNTGVYGVAGSAANVAEDTRQTGVYGFVEGSAAATGVWGDSNSLGVWGTGGDTGVQGNGFWGVVGQGDELGVGVVGTGTTGVWAFPLGSAPSGASPNAGLSAEAPWPKNAAHFSGRTTFSRSGKLVVPAGASSVAKSIPLGGSSLIFAVVISNRSGVWVTRVVSSPTAGSFRVYLNTRVSASTYVAYFVVN